MSSTSVKQIPKNGSMAGRPLSPAEILGSPTQMALPGDSAPPAAPPPAPFEYWVGASVSVADLVEMSRLAAEAAKLADGRDKLVKSIRRECVLMTPDLATEILKWPFKYQRPPVSSKITTLARDMRRGKFTPETGTIKMCRSKGRRYVYVDGQHRLLSVILSGVPQIMYIEWMEVENPEDVATLYARIDSGKNRVLKDVVHAHGLTDEINLTKSEIDSLGAAIRLLSSGFKTYTTPINLRSENVISAIRDWAPEAREFFALLRVGDRANYKRLSSAADMAVALVAIRNRHDQALKFWGLVASNSGLHKGTPEYALCEMLKTTSFGKSDLAARKVACAWNAFYAGRGIEKINVKSSTVFRIMGCDGYEGKSVAIYTPPVEEDEEL
jgi:hypothetical protein